MILSGVNSEDYYVNYGNLTSITIVSGQASVPPPTISSAIFSPYGIFITVTFSGPTDRARLSGVFSCDKISEFSGAAVSRCQWQDPSTLQISLHSTSLLVPGNLISLRGGILRASCTVGLSAEFCSSWDTASRSSVSVKRSTLKLTPFVVLSMPTLIGKCDNLVVDFADSTGSGGRPWQSINVSVASSNLNISKLVTFLDDTDVGSTGRVVVPNRLLESASTYRWLVRVCNFLNFCGESSALVAVSNSAIPQVRILGPPFRIVGSKQSVEVSSLASVRSCDGSVSSRNLQYSWHIYDSSGNALSDVVTTSRDPTGLRLPPFTLRVDSTYRIVSTVLNTVSMLSSSASVTVYVSPGTVKAVIAGSSAQSFRADQTLQLDGSGSYDEDTKTASLTYQWSCVREKPVPGSKCGVVFVSSPSGVSLKVAALTSDYITESTVTLTVHGSGGRFSTASVTILVTEPLAPIVVIRDHSITINAFDKLRLNGYFESAEAGIAEWTVDDESISLAIAATTPSVVPYGSRINASKPVMVNLALLGGSLYSRSEFTFTLKYTTIRSLSSSASVRVITNGAPLNGIFNVDPLEGVMLSTAFTMSASQWQDEDLPISYQYAYSTSAGSTFVVYRSKLELSYCETVLPGGIPDMRYAVTVRARIFDGLGANTSSYMNVIVKPVVVDSDTLQDMVEKSVSTSELNNNDARGTIGLVTSILNSANCSVAPICAPLHRWPCTSVDHTCGLCLPGFVGEDSHSNAACYDPADFGARRRLSRQNMTCSDDSDCLGHWQACNVNVCEVMPKSCPNDCSGNGDCLYRSVHDGSMWRGVCRVGNVLCQADCVCRPNMTGPACETTYEELQLKQALRLQLISGLRNIIAGENIDPEAVMSWVSSLSMIAPGVNELDATGKSWSTDVARRILESAISASIPYSFVVDIVRVISALSWTEYDAIEVGNIVENSVASMQELLGLYTSLIGAQLSVGETEVATKTSTFSAVTVVHDMTYGQDVTLFSPLSTIEIAAGVNAQEVTFNGDDSWSEGAAMLSLIVSKAGLYNASTFNSDAVRLRYSSSLCSAESEDCAVEITLQNWVEVEYDSPDVPTLTAECFQGSQTTHILSCPVGGNISLHCNGSWAGQGTVQCPSRHAAAVCNTLSGIYAASSSCTLLAFTADNTTCSCPLNPSVRVDAAGDKRRLEYANSTTADVEFVAMLLYTTDGFVTTWQSADALTLASVQQSWKVLLTAMIAVGVAAVGAIWGMRADEETAKRVTAANDSLVVSAAKTKTFISIDNRLKNPKALIEESLPKVMKDGTPFTERFSQEVKVYHRWLGIIFFYSPHFTRVVRILSLATTVVVMLFANAVTYNTAYPDDGSCENYRTRVDCVQEESSFSGDTKCYWSQDGSCAFREPSSNLKQVVFVATIAAIMSTPIAVFADYVIMAYIAADVISKRSRVDRSISRQPAKRPRQSRGPQPGQVIGDSFQEEVRMACSTDKFLHRRQHSWANPISESRRESGRTNSERGKNLPTSLQADMSLLVKSLREYRMLLSEVDRRSFDDMWGLTEEGTFISSASAASGLLDSLQAAVGIGREDVYNTVMLDLQKVRMALSLEVKRYQFSILTDEDRGKRLLFLFQKDLLPGVNAMILESKGRRDFLADTNKVEPYQKALAGLFIVTLNVGLLFYIYLFSIRQSNDRQEAWFLSFCVWLVLEVVLMSTIAVYVTHFLVPSLVMRDLYKVKKRLLQTIREYKKGILTEREDKRKFEFNVADYFFVSSRLSSLYPDLVESKIISRFSSPWPHQSYQRTRSVSKSYSKRFSTLMRSMSMIVVFFLKGFLSTPPAVQDAIVQLSTVVVTGNVFSGLVSLYEISPFLPMFSALIVLLILYTLIKLVFHSVGPRQVSPVAAKGTLGGRRKIATVAHPSVVASQTIRNRERFRNALDEDSKPAAGPSVQLQTRRQSIQLGEQTIREMQRYQFSHTSPDRSVVGIMFCDVSDESDPGSMCDLNVKELLIDAKAVCQNECGFGDDLDIAEKRQNNPILEKVQDVHTELCNGSSGDGARVKDMGQKFYSNSIQDTDCELSRNERNNVALKDSIFLRQRDNIDNFACISKTAVLLDKRDNALFPAVRGEILAEDSVSEDRKLHRNAYIADDISQELKKALVPAVWGELSNSDPDDSKDSDSDDNFFNQMHFFGAAVSETELAKALVPAVWGELSDGDCD